MSKRAPMIQDNAGVWHKQPYALPVRPEHMDFQIAGSNWLRQRACSLLGDDMGLGKTCQAIEVIDMLPEDARVLICCPAGLRINWMRELAMWLTKMRRCVIAKRYVSPAPVVIVSYDQLQKLEIPLRAFVWDLVICDEAHLIRNPWTIRCRQVLGDEWTLPLRAKRKILLTGTPITKDAGQLWTLLTWLGLTMPRDLFILRAHTDNEWLRGTLNAVMLRRMKVDVMKDLPAKTRQIVRVEPSGAARAAVAAEMAWERACELRKFGGCKFSETAELRQRTALAKLAMPEVQSHLREAVESSGRVVIFCWHHSTVQRVLALFAEMKLKAFAYTGLMRGEDRQKAVDDFQGYKGEAAAFIATIGAGAVGITLTAASHVIFLEETYDPTEATQAEDRAWRKGQRNAVLIQHLVLNGSIDCRQIERQIEKQKVIDKAINPT